MNATELAFVNLLLVILSLCGIAITSLLWVGIQFLWKRSRRLDMLLSQGEKTLVEAQRGLATVRQLVTRTDRAAGNLEQVIHRSCRTAGSILEEIEAAQEKVHSFWNKSFGNGHVAKVRVRNRG